MAIKIEVSDLDFNMQLKTFASKIGTYQALLGISASDVSVAKADALAMDYIINCQDLIQKYSQNFTAFKNQLRKGSDQPLGPMPLLAAFPVAPTMPAANIQLRFRQLLQRITHSPNYTKAIGEDLGIEAPVAGALPVNPQPLFNIELSSGGYPNLRWTKGRHQGVEIWKDSGQGFIKLDRDMKPDYIDKSDLPAMGISQVWKYKMIYLLNDEPFGQWSDTKTVTVVGEV